MHSDRSTIPKKISFLKWFSFTLMLLTSLLLTWIYTSTYHPNDIEVEAILTTKNVPILKQGQKIKVLSWNIQFLAGNTNNHFFMIMDPTIGLH